MIDVDTTNTILTISGIDVQIVRKDIKNLHLAVYPPDGHVRVAVPEHVSDDNVRLAVVSKLSWIKKQRKEFEDQPRQSERQYISGECHYFNGVRYRLELIERVGKHEIKILQSAKMKMYVNPGTSVSNKEKLLNEWYRRELKNCILALIDKWHALTGEQILSWGIKKMKTKWGSCNIDKRRIWLNLELAKKPVNCIEYVVVHEMVHLIERNHNARFIELMDRFMPNWRLCRNELNKLPVSHADWKY